MATKDTIAEISAKLQELWKEREDLLARLDEINAVFHSFGIDPERGRRTRSSRRTRGTGKRRGLRPGGKRVQGVKQTLLESLSATPQSPTELAANVSQKLGKKVAITTQLHMLKREKLAKAASRGQWVRV